MIRNKFVLSMLVLAFLLGVLIGSAVFIDKLEQNKFQMDRLVRTCDSYYGMQNWTVTKDNTGKYTCTGIGAIPVNFTTVDWRQRK